MYTVLEKHSKHTQSVSSIAGSKFKFVFIGLIFYIEARTCGVGFLSGESPSFVRA